MKRHRARFTGAMTTVATRHFVGLLLLLLLQGRKTDFSVPKLEKKVILIVYNFRVNFCRKIIFFHFFKKKIKNY
jgi:hypothetical protein